MYSSGTVVLLNNMSMIVLADMHPDIYPFIICLKSITVLLSVIIPHHYVRFIVNTIAFSFDNICILFLPKHDRENGVYCGHS